jgi:hypothetical protein
MVGLAAPSDRLISVRDGLRDLDGRRVVGHVLFLHEQRSEGSVGLPCVASVTHQAVDEPAEALMGVLTSRVRRWDLHLVGSRGERGLRRLSASSPPRSNPPKSQPKRR